MIKTCESCKFRWFGSVDKNVHFAQFYCSRRGDVRRKDMPVIGSDKELKAALGCKDWRKYAK